ncbi:MAG: PHP domain-containing protein [Acidobacteriota bacterium]
MNPAQTQVLRLERGAERLKQFRMAASLHSHTHYSHENLEALPEQAKKFPIVGKIVQSELERYTRGCGRKIDFRKTYWTPPVSPKLVLESETRQIEQLGLPAVVSITDHDSIAAGLSLQSTAASVPVSVEWTIPFRGDHLHMGVHHLPADRARQIMEDLAAFTTSPDESRLGDLLDFLNAFEDTLLVLNHPCWDVTRVGPAEHANAVRDLLQEHGERIHALEINGLRGWSENCNALRMAKDYDMPIVAGGDRHGRRPNTMLNLSHAASWQEFVTDVRVWRRNHVLILPSYEEPLALRQMEIVADALRYYPDYPYGQRSFRGRTYLDMDGYSCHPLSFYWERGEPLWLQLVLCIFVALGSSGFRPLLRHTLFRQGEKDLMVSSINDYAELGASMQKAGPNS